MLCGLSCGVRASIIGSTSHEEKGIFFLIIMGPTRIGLKIWSTSAAQDLIAREKSNAETML